MEHGKKHSVPLWAYAYQILPAQTTERMLAVSRLLTKEHSLASRLAHSWEGRFVLAELATHILVVADTPDQAQDANRRLEGALEQLGVRFLLTVPMPVES